MTISRADTTGLYARLASLLRAEVSRPAARNAGIAISHDIVALAHADHQAVFLQLGASPDGLDPIEAAKRLKTIGPNLIGQEARPASRANSSIGP